MQDVAFGFLVETCRREVQSCSDIDHMRRLTLQVLQLMESQRSVLRQMIDEHNLDPRPSIVSPSQEG